MGLIVLSMVFTRPDRLSRVYEIKLAGTLKFESNEPFPDNGKTRQQKQTNKPQETMRPILNALALLAIVIAGLTTAYAQDPLPSWNDGPAKQAIVDFVKATTENGGPNFVAARGTHRHLRPGRHALGRASDVLAGDVLPRPRAGAGQGEARTRQGRAVQHRSELLDGDRAAMAKLTMDDLDEDPRRHAHRHVGRGIQRRSEEVARRRPRTRAGSGPTPNSPTCRCRRC